MNAESKLTDPKAEEDAAKDILGQSSTTDQDSAEDVEPADSKDPDSVAAGSVTKKKKSKKAKLKKALGVSSKHAGKDESGSNPASKLTGNMVEQLLEMNPSLKSEVSGMDKEEAAETLKKIDVADLLTGMSVSGKNQKDMASYKFWQTQPVPRFGQSLGTHAVQG